MNCILDTHVLIFLGCGYDNRIGQKALDVYKKHKDPFDRYIISTALCEDMRIISSDSKFDLYSNVIRIWMRDDGILSSSSL